MVLSGCAASSESHSGCCSGFIVTGSSAEGLGPFQFAVAGHSDLRPQPLQFSILSFQIPLAQRPWLPLIRPVEPLAQALATPSCRRVGIGRLARFGFPLPSD